MSCTGTRRLAADKAEVRLARKIWFEGGLSYVTHLTKTRKGKPESKTLSTRKAFLPRILEFFEFIEIASFPSTLISAMVLLML